MNIDIETIWSAALGAMALVTNVLAGSKRQSAWVVGGASQIGWTGFMIYTGNYGFVVSVIGFSLVYIRNWRLWKNCSMSTDPGLDRRAGRGRSARVAFAQSEDRGNPLKEDL